MRPARQIPSLTKTALRRLAGQIVRFPADRSFAHQRVTVLRRSEVQLVLDVGANGGQFAAEIRAYGYQGKIISYEPLTAPFQRLALRAAHDADWEVVQTALGATPDTTVMNVAANMGASSSILPMLQAHTKAAPHAGYVGQETVQVQRLDDLVGDRPAALRTFLKLDVQGFERDVMRGGEATLEKIVGLQIELSLQPLYEGQMLYAEVLDWARAGGFALVGIEPGLVDHQSGVLLQADALFVRPDTR